MRSRITGFILILLVTLTQCKSKKVQLKHQDYKVEAIDTTEFGDESITQLIAPYKNQLDGTMNKTIGISEVSIIKGVPESLLGNFVTDICKQKLEKFFKQPIDFVVLNTGGLRAPLPKGEITVRHIYELMPFENELVLVKMKGSDLKTLFTHIARSGGMPLSKGISIGVKRDQYTVVKIGEDYLDEHKTYWIGTSNYLITGGDKFDFSKAVEVINTGLTIRESLIEEIELDFKAGKTIHPQLEGRIYGDD